MATPAKILAEEISDILKRAVHDLRLQPAALQVRISDPLPVSDGYLITVSIKNNRGKTNSYGLLTWEVE